MVLLSIHPEKAYHGHTHWSDCKYEMQPRQHKLTISDNKYLPGANAFKYNPYVFRTHFRRIIMASFAMCLCSEENTPVLCFAHHHRSCRHFVRPGIDPCILHHGGIVLRKNLEFKQDWSLFKYVSKQSSPCVSTIRWIITRWVMIKLCQKMSIEVFTLIKTYRML